MLTLSPHQFISELHSSESCTGYLHEFLDLIQKDMMIVKPNDKKDTPGRITCMQLHPRLLRMLQRCKSDKKYASTPAPRLRNEIEQRFVEEAVEAELEQSAAEVLEKKDLRIHTGRTQRRCTSACQTNPGGCETMKFA